MNTTTLQTASAVHAKQVSAIPTQNKKIDSKQKKARVIVVAGTHACRTCDGSR